MRAVAALGVEMVLRAVEDLPVVALRAERVPLFAQPRRVRLVAMAAGDSARRHLALQEGADLEHLVLDLSVDEVEAILQQLRAPGVVHALVGGVLPQPHAARVADAASIELLGLRVHPGHQVPRGCAVLRGLDVRRAGAVAALAAVAELAPLAVEPTGRVREALAEAGGVAVAAHVIPVLPRAHPEERIPGRHVGLRIQVEPALAAARALARVPGERQRLDAPVVQLHQVLLQRRVPQRVSDLERLGLALLVLGRHEERRTAARKARLAPEVAEGDVAEVAEDAARVGPLHGVTVMGRRPGRLLGGMARRTGLRTDEMRGRRHGATRRARRLSSARSPPEREPSADGDRHRHERDAAPSREGGDPPC